MICQGYAPGIQHISSKTLLGLLTPNGVHKYLIYCYERFLYTLQHHSQDKKSILKDTEVIFFSSYYLKDKLFLNQNFPRAAAMF